MNRGFEVGDRFMTLEARLMEMNHKIMDLDIKKANK